jgi:hypothetical protein
VSKSHSFEYLLPCDVAELLRCSERTLARMRSLRTGPAYSKCGGRILYPRAAVHDWVARNIILPVAQAA